MRTKLFMLTVSLASGFIVAGCMTYSYRHLPKTDNAPTLGPAFRATLIAYYEADAERLWPMLTQEDRDWNDARYKEARNCNNMEEDAKRREKEADLQNRYKTHFRGTPEYAAYEAENAPLADEGMELQAALETSSPSEFFTKRIKYARGLRTLNAMGNNRKTTWFALAFVNVTSEKLSGNEGTLTYHLGGNSTAHEIRFKREGGKWKLCGLRHLTVFEDQFDPDCDPSDAPTPR